MPALQDMTFDRVWMLTLAPLLAALLAWGVVLAHRRRRRRLHGLGGPEMVPRLVTGGLAAPPGWRAARLGLAALCAGVALAGPRWGVEPTPSRGSGLDAVLVLDGSLSMLARDERPSRLERMKQEVRRLRSLAGGDRVALLAFAGRSYILTPLTLDDGALDLYLSTFDPSVVGQPGTSLSRPIEQAVALLEATPSRGDKAIVLFTDGEAHEPVEEIVRAASRVRDAGIAFVAMGFGTTQGATIPIEERGAVTEKRDQEGNVVVTRYRPDVLRAAAEAAGGTFIDAAEPDRPGRVRAALATLRRTARAAGSGRDRRPQFQLFLVPAILLLALETLLADRVRRTEARGAAASVPPPAPPPRVARASSGGAAPGGPAPRAEAASFTRSPAGASPKE